MAEIYELLSPLRGRSRNALVKYFQRKGLTPNEITLPAIAEESSRDLWLAPNLGTRGVEAIADLLMEHQVIESVEEWLAPMNENLRVAQSGQTTPVVKAARPHKHLFHQPVYVLFDHVPSFQKELLASIEEADPALRFSVVHIRRGSIPLFDVVAIATARTANSVLRLNAFLGQCMEGDSGYLEQLMGKAEKVKGSLDTFAKEQGFTLRAGIYSLESSLTPS